MENFTEEKGLVKIDNSIFARVRRFLTNIFKKKNYCAVDLTENKNEVNSLNSSIEQNAIEEINDTNEKTQENKNEERNAQTELEYEGKEELEQKLMNYYASIKTSLKQ